MVLVHWNGNVLILMKFSTLAALEVVIWQLSVQSVTKNSSTLQWRHNECDGVSYHLTIVYSTVYLGAYQRKHQSSASLAFVQGIHQWPVNSPSQRASNAENVSIWWCRHGWWHFYNSVGAAIRKDLFNINVTHHWNRNLIIFSKFSKW